MIPIYPLPAFAIFYSITWLTSPFLGNKSSWDHLYIPLSISIVETLRPFYHLAFNQRWLNDGEWTFISPVGSEPAKVPPRLVQDIYQLQKANAILAGAVSPRGNIIALLEITGTTYLLPLRSDAEGLACTATPIFLGGKLSFQEKKSRVSLGFHVREPDKHLYLYAIDVKGNVIEKFLEKIPTPAPNPAESKI